MKTWRNVWYQTVCPWVHLLIGVHYLPVSILQSRFQQQRHPLYGINVTAFIRHSIGLLLFTFFRQNLNIFGMTLPVSYFVLVIRFSSPTSQLLDLYDIQSTSPRLCNAISMNTSAPVTLLENFERMAFRFSEQFWLNNADYEHTFKVLHKLSLKWKDTNVYCC